MAKNIQLNLTNKSFYSIIAIGIFILVGIGVFAYNSDLNSPNIFGHTINEISVIDSEGNEISLEKYINDEINEAIGGVGELSCSDTPIYNSMVLKDSASETGVAYNDNSYRYNNGIKIVPNSCKSDAGCIIKQEIYDKNGLKLTRQYDYVQYSSNKWWSSYRTAGTYLNGDLKYTDVIPGYSDSSLRLLDDYYKSGSVAYTNETSSETWTFVDRSGSYGMKIYICSSFSD